MDRKNFLIHGSKMILASTIAGMRPPGSVFTADSPVGTNGAEPSPGNLTLFLSGDVMAGRGIDQVMPRSSDARLYEPHIKNAKEYVTRAERKNGPIPDEVEYHYVWGDALLVLEQQDPDARIINLETAVTTSSNHSKEKLIHYRMHPENIPLLTTAGIDICVLGNNHVLDWGRDGLMETLTGLRKAGLKTAGAGPAPEAASAPACMNTGAGRLLLFSYGTTGAGVPMAWQAGKDRPGVNMLPNIDSKTAGKVAGDIRKYRGENDRVVVSLHWGGNWGYEVPFAHQKFAHRLIDSGMADVIHGHSSHHPKGIEVYNGRLILYGCGDLINDYEGIHGHEEFRDDLSLLYFLTVSRDGELISLRMIPMRLYRFRLQRASKEDARWLENTLDRECRRFGGRIAGTSGGELVLQPMG